MLSLPGSTRQKSHSDIPYTDNDLILSGLVALSRVDIINGPTYLYAGTHTKAFHSTHVTNNVPKGERDLLSSCHYASDGSISSEFDNSHNESNENSESSETNEDTLSNNAATVLAAASSPMAAVLNIGKYSNHNINI